MRHVRKSKRITKRRPRKGGRARVPRSTLVNRARPSNKLVFPERYITKMQQSYSIYIGAGAITSSGLPAGGANSAFSASFTTYINSIYQPFLTSTPITGVGTGLPGFANTQSPTSYSAMSGLYQYYKVHWGSIRLRVQPQNISDTIFATLVPIGNEGVVTGSALNVFQMANQPYSKSLMCIPGVRNTIKGKMSCYKILGLTKRQYLDQPQTSLTSKGGLPTLAIWDIQLAMSDGAINAGAITVEVDLMFGVEFTSLLSQLG
nr:MAG: capsid protein [Cressdnaviricota sp.]